MLEAGYHMHEQDFVYRRQARRKEAERFRISKATRRDNRIFSLSRGRIFSSLSERARAWLAPTPSPKEHCG
jgi:hypothetical protein